jgi:hypothetical protein
MIWMRASATPTFRKLWGRIDSDVSAGKYQVDVQNTWDVALFSGEKKFLISQTNAFGGKNIFLGSCYVAIGSLCIIAAIVFLGRKMYRSKGILESKLN